MQQVGAAIAGKMVIQGIAGAGSVIAAGQDQVFDIGPQDIVEIGQDLMVQLVFDELKRERVSTDFVISEKSEQTAVSVLLISGDGGRAALTRRGAASHLEARDIPGEAL